jgi:hypothetical protein
MPNHTHGVIIITDRPDDADDDAPDRSSPISDDDGRNTHGGWGSTPMNPYHHDEKPNRRFGGHCRVVIHHHAAIQIDGDETH